MRVVSIGCMAAVLALSACGGAAGTKSATETATAAGASPSESAPAELGTIKESGFGQNGEYVWATAVVHNNSKYVGQTVTVQFNVMDSEGEILGSESAVEPFYRPDADHALGAQVDLEPGQKAATVEATLDVEATGAFSDKSFPEVSTGKVAVSEKYGAHEASFEVTNPLSVAMKSPRIAVVCRKGSDDIIGGGTTYPELVPASGKAMVDAHILVTGDPAGCDIFTGPPIDWDGEGLDSEAPDSSESPADTAGSAEAALKTWLEQFNAKDWEAHYATLVSAQRAVISEDRYATCRSQDAPPKFTWEKVLAVKDAGETAIPGTDVELPSTQVSAQVSMEGVKVPVDSHMVLEDGEWHWMMTQENIDNCV